MRLIRLYLAISILRGAGLLAGAIAGPALTDRLPLRPVERMLLGSIVGLAICTLWIWTSARAGR
ncbi:hypothetical protein [Mesorhizobium sp. A556]